jgi:hypothetical protein
MCIEFATKWQQEAIPCLSVYLASKTLLQTIPSRMTYKRTPTDDEIETLAAQFRPLWRTGEAVRPWLRKHAVMLIDLVHDDWSWAGVAIALDRAGIAYKTGNPWQAEQLRAKIAAARRPLKRNALSSAQRSSPA